MNIVKLAAPERASFSFIFGLWRRVGCLCTTHRHHVVFQYRPLRDLLICVLRMFNIDRRCFMYRPTNTANIFEIIMLNRIHALTQILLTCRHKAQYESASQISLT